MERWVAAACAGIAGAVTLRLAGELGRTVVRHSPGLDRRLLGERGLHLRSPRRLPRRARTLRIALYSSAGLVVAALYSMLAQRRLPPVYTQPLPIDRAAL